MSSSLSRDSLNFFVMFPPTGKRTITITVTTIAIVRAIEIRSVTWESERSVNRCRSSHRQPPKQRRIELTASISICKSGWSKVATTAAPTRCLMGRIKTLWGAEQIAWLKRTLLESDATWKLLISPTPMVGPDDAYKIDNHTNHQGFRHEGRAFFNWIKEQRLDQKGFHVICGDRHWQYHSIDPMGIEELSSGALVDSNSRLGRDPGDPKSTDPKATIRQLHTQTQASGGFLRVTVNDNGSIRFEFFDENGKSLYHTVKKNPDSLPILQ